MNSGTKAKIGKTGMFDDLSKSTGLRGCFKVVKITAIEPLISTCSPPNRVRDWPHEASNVSFSPLYLASASIFVIRTVL
jgi:hypothetical protein